MTQTMATGGGHGAAWRVAGWGLAALLLVVPLVAMRLTDEVNWTASDFAFAAALIGAVGGGLELAVRASRHPAYRGGAALTLFACLFITWVNAAVGIVGDEGEAFNLVYPGIVAITLAGSVGAGFAARGMMRATAFSAASVLAIAPLAIMAGGAVPPGALRLGILHAMLAAMFTLAALLFRRAARDQSMRA